MKNFILIFIFLITSLTFSQTKVKGIVIDEQNEPVAFANIIFKNSIKGTVSDENGNFYLESSKTYSELDISFLGYETKTITLQKVNYGLQIILKETGASLDEVVIYSGKIKKKGNPAIAILRKMWKKKRKNGIYMYDRYQYDKYEKIEFDLNSIDAAFKKQRVFKGMEFIFDKVDTSKVTGKTYLPFFINESVYKTYGKNTSPKKLRDELIANKNSGFQKNQNVNEFLKQLYTDYNIYDNYIKIFDKSFTSPISRTGPSVYNYVLTDSAFIDDKWCYNILFYPRRKNELTFKGDFWVNDSTFAVKEIQMHATRSANINWVKEIYIEQEFNVLNDSVFLIKRDHIMSEFALRKKEKSRGVYGKRTTMYDNYEFDVEKETAFYTKRNTANYDESIFDKSKEYWEENRMEKLNDDEDSIYKLLDTLKTNRKFKNLYTLTEVLASGYWQFIPGFDYGPVYSTFGNNDIEGTRIRIGGRSYVKPSDKLRVEGFLAYGFKDQKFKYGIAGKWLLNKRNRLILSVGNRNDIEQTGVSLTTSNNVLDRSFASAALFARGDNFNLTKLNLSNISLEIEPIKNLTFQLGTSYRELESADPERFDVNFRNEEGDIQSSIKQVTADFAIKYTPKRKSGGFGVDQQVINEGRYPILYLNYSRGLKNVLDSDFDYHKFQFYYQHRVQVGGLGKLKYVLEVGKTFNDVPLLLMDVVPGNQSPLIARRTFDLLDFYEFITDEYMSMHLEHNFNGRIFSRIPLLRKLNLREVIGARGVFGTISESNRLTNASTTINYLAPEDLYWEYHVGVDNIFKLLRVDFIFRGSHRNLPEATNFAIKGGINFYF
ncbi:MAG: DUF5686 and carboxypeptidase regulatory-like domain-containing protein [Flavobacteriaceae bacterium]|nr:DUF5686 and carboxypeptidase regulatory-like domain-containing protein [Flavobacteriaceae bacterium]